MLTLGSYLEERAAKLCREALGRIQVALAGSAPNSMYTTIDSFFGYQADDETEETPEETERPEATPVYQNLWGLSLWPYSITSSSSSSLRKNGYSGAPP